MATISERYAQRSKPNKGEIMKDSLQNIADILAEPSAAFARLKSEPKWLLAMVIFCLFSVGIAWAMFSFTANR